MRNEGTVQPATRPLAVEPSRAWILGIVVDADGSLSTPGPADSAWPSAGPDAAARPERTMIPDGSTVRP